MFGHLTVSAICIILIVIDCHRQHKQTYMDHHHHHLISHLENCIQRLPISHRINFKLATFGYKIQSTSQPTLSSSTPPPPVHRLLSVTIRSSRRPLNCSRCHGLELHTAVALSAWLYRTIMEYSTRRCARCELSEYFS